MLLKPHVMPRIWIACEFLIAREVQASNGLFPELWLDDPYVRRVTAEVILPISCRSKNPQLLMMTVGLSRQPDPKSMERFQQRERYFGNQWRGIDDSSVA